MKVLPPIVNCVTAMLGPSTSMSLPSTLPDTGVSSSVVDESLTPTGASFTAVTFNVSVLGAASKAPLLSCTLKLKFA